MNIWDVIFSIIGGVVKQAEKQQKELQRYEDRQQKDIQRYEDKYRNLNHDELVNKYNNSSGNSRAAAYKLLVDEKKRKANNK